MNRSLASSPCLWRPKYLDIILAVLLFGMVGGQSYAEDSAPPNSLKARSEAVDFKNVPAELLPQAVEESIAKDPAAATRILSTALSTNEPLSNDVIGRLVQASIRGLGKNKNRYTVTAIVRIFIQKFPHSAGTIITSAVQACGNEYAGAIAQAAAGAGSGSGKETVGKDVVGVYIIDPVQDYFMPPADPDVDYNSLHWSPRRLQPLTH